MSLQREETAIASAFQALVPEIFDFADEPKNAGL
jgi:hypothetical protein